MLKVIDVGDTSFIPDEQVDRIRFAQVNQDTVQQGGEPAKGEPLILGITKASLATDGFISAASFQETTKVLTEATMYGSFDSLRGLKENVIMGRIIPAGTGFPKYRKIQIDIDELEKV